MSSCALIVHEDVELRAYLAAELGAIGFTISEASDWEHASRALASDHCQFVATTAFLGDVDMVSRLVRWPDRQFGLVAVLPCDLEALGPALLEQGADEFVLEPKLATEFRARVRSVVRRMWPVDRQEIVFDDLVIDTAARTVTVDGLPMFLTKLEFDLLAYLAARPYRALSFRELLEGVWGGATEGHRTASVTEHIRRVRMKLGLERNWIKTVRGYGYMFEPIRH
jgi:DNA-binding response OmpR family regulator